ncbi:MAG: alpha-galactosidase [Promethearchaeota archaeon]
MFAKISGLKRFIPPANDLIETDWLLDPSPFKSEIFGVAEKSEIIISNGLVSRTFKMKPDCATIGYDNLMTGEAIIRGVKPEGKITINNRDYNIGGLIGQVEYAYFLPEWADDLKVDANAFHVVDFDTGIIKERFPWKQVRYALNKKWPPAGKTFSFIYRHDDLKGVEIQVHYEIYDGIPLLSKWIDVNNKSEKLITVNKFTSEILAMVESSSVPQGDPNKSINISQIHMESDYIFSSMSAITGNFTSVWTVDPQYTSQVAYNSDSLVLLESKPPIGPEMRVEPGSSFTTFRTYELIFDSTDRERRSLGVRRMYRTLAPWVTENPILMHVISADPKKVREAINQCKEVGFEMIIISFGSGLNMEWADEPEYIEEYKELFDFAYENGIEIGGYSLFSSRRISDDDDVVPYQGKKPTFGNAPCLCSRWGINYLRLVKKFLKETGANVLEHDGPYPGDICASTSHPGHDGPKDSQWKQWKSQCDLYKWCREHGIYVNQPDWYFLSGGNKTGMGYKEVNWSLPRERQVIIARQNIYDGTWEKTPSMGWMFTPLTRYHAVGEWKKSTLEPLSKHLEFYEAHLSQNFLSGVQSCYRGTRLFDNENTKKVVKKWVDIYKKHRLILDSDIIHIRRPDGRHVDGILHVNPAIEEKGFAVFYNPLNENIEMRIRVPLYFTGIKEQALVSREDGPPFKQKLDRNYNITLKLDIAPRSRTWFVIKEGK